MAETIEVGYKPAIIDGVTVYHKYILYTNNQGEQFYSRGGPGYFGPGSVQGGSEEASFSPTWGNIKTESGKYEVGTPDWDPARDPYNPDTTDSPDFREPIKTGNDLSSDWGKIKDAMKDIDLEDHPYFPELSNSNTSVDNALKRSGLPQPVHDGIGPNWSPASGNDFPDTSHLPEWLKRHPDPNKPIPGDANRNGIPDIHESKIDPKSNSKWNDSKNWRQRRDPLTLDLDGDGLETTGAGTFNPIYFDHDGDGIKNGSGWVKSDDAFLVLDKNGNGLIDNGRELFGDNFIKSSGQTAKDGFDALTDLDSNADGIVNAQDIQYINLKLWRDLNQDGISQDGELFTLDSQNIVGINITKTANNQTLSNGNQIADTGSFIKGDGSSGTVGEVTGNMADINLADDTFHRQFPDKLDTTTVANLPDMQGSGAVRDLREAATQSATLQNLLTQYSAATTREGQFALIDQMLDAWADTSGYKESYDDRIEGMNYIIYGDGLQSMDVAVPYVTRYMAFGSVQRELIETTAIGTSGGDGGGGSISPSEPARDLDNDRLTAHYKNLIMEWTQKIHILEAFNGNYFFGLPTQPEKGAKTGLTIVSVSSGSTNTGSGGSSVSIPTQAPIEIRYNQTQLDLLQQSYDALRQSVYDALLLQTRFKPVLDSIKLVADASGIRIDFTQTQNYFETKISQNAALGVSDLIEFNKNALFMLNGTSWQGYELLETKLRELPVTSDLQAVYNTFNVSMASGTSTGTIKDEIILGGLAADTIYSGAGGDVVYAGGEDDYINGGDDIDVLYGQEGNDFVYGGNGNDLLIGGTGNDHLAGGVGNDTYLFDLGFGQDTINNYNGLGIVGDESDLVRFGAGIATTDVTLTRINSDLQLDINNTTDRLVIMGYFSRDVTTSSAVNRIQFYDGTTWGIEDVKNKVLTSTIGGDTIIGYASNDNLSGWDGNDVLSGHGGNDTLDGGTGNDVLNGDTGDDVLSGDTGSDRLNGGVGNDALNGGIDDDVLFGGAGADTLLGDIGNDDLSGDEGDDMLAGGLGDDYLDGSKGINTYQFSRGDGQDTINNSDKTSDHTDILSLGSDILATDVVLVRVLDNLEIRINNTTDKITITNHFTTSPISQLLFSDGTQWLQSSLDSRLSILPTTSDDILGGKSVGDVISGLAGNDNIFGYNGNDTLNGGDGQDILYGDEGGDTLNGDAGLDSIYGGLGNNIIDGGAHNDDLSGGLGDDTYIYNVGSGVDTIHEVVDSQFNIDKVLFGEGISTSNIYYEKSGNDLNFRINSNDYLIIKNFFLTSDIQYKVEQFVFTDGTVWTSQNIQALLTTPTLNNDVISGYDWADNINGLDGNDKLYGNGGDDTLIGGQGYDTLNGGAGNDLLDGGSENDSITGGVGNDTLIGGTGNDILVGETGDDIYKYQRGDGLDTISDTSGNDLLLLGTGILPTDVSLLRDGNKLFLVLNGNEISIQLTNDQVETIQFENGTVWNLAEIQARTAFGAANTYTGTTGNDNYVVDNNSDIINEAASQGTDSVTSSVSYILGANVENLTLTGFLNLDASGNTLDNVITGNSGNNLINGGGYYTGYSADGADVLIGGAGNDTYYATGGDLVTELADGGNDTIYTSSSGFVLPDNVENLVIVGEYQYYMSATGNALNNTMIARGNWYNQVLDGGAGADYMSGGYDTTFYVDNIGDVVGGVGNYKVYSSVDFTLAAHWDGIYFNNIIETIVLTGADAIKATGNVGNNALDGRQNSAANILEGGAGDDTYYVDANDTIVEQANGGNDTLMAYANYPYFAELFKASNNIENIVVMTSYNGHPVYNNNPIDLEGSEGDNRLVGNNGVNNIRGLGGNDTIEGGTNWGDTLDGGDGEDKIYGSGWLYGGAGNDYLSASYSSTLSGGAGNDTLYGRGLDTYIFTKGDGQDTIHDYTSYDPATAVNPASYYRDKIRFGAEITEHDVLLSREGDNLVISIADTEDSIIVEKHFAAANGNVSSSIEQLQFENGSVWDVAAIETRIARNNINAASELSDMLIGTSENNYIQALGGNDIISGGDGEDRLEGGIGNDTLFGNSGIDILIGGVGDDTLQGGAGADIYQFGRGAGLDIVIDPNNNAEIDTILIDSDLAPSQIAVKKSGLYDLDLTLSISDDSAQLTIQHFYTSDATSARAKQVVFADGTVWDAVKLADLANSYFGTTLNDVMTGAEAADKLYGFEGNDTLNGLDGDDKLDGGLDADALIGGLGSDTYIVDNSGDTITEELDEGIDIVQSSITHTLSANVENLTLIGSEAINGNGNFLDNILIGNVANNVLIGNVGMDVLQGDSGNDSLLGGANDDMVYGGGGDDLLQADANLSTITVRARASLAIDVGANMELWIDGVKTSATEVRSTSYADYSFNVVLPVGRDVKLDVVFANDAVINGQDRNLFVESVKVDDYLMYPADSGVSYDRGTASGAFDGVNVIAGQSTMAWNGALRFTVPVSVLGTGGDDWLDGEVGNDTMNGGVGNDTYMVDSTGDTITELGNEGVDAVQSSITYTLGVNVENLTLIGEEAINGRGNLLDNLLIGNIADNTLNGNAGIDMLQGDLGNDNLIGGSASDLLIGGEGDDTLQSDASVSLITVRAKASLAADVGANMELWVDGVKAGTVAISSINYADYSFDVALPLGRDVSLDVVFANDAVINGQDRNLFVESVKVDDYLMLPADNSVSYDRGTANGAFDGIDIIAGQSTMAWNGALRFMVPQDAIALDGSDIIIGGIGNDVITTGEGYDVISFNIGDGQDVINASTGADNTISLGGNFAYSDLSLSKTDNDLVLKVGIADQITLKDWYLGTTNKSVVNLQVIAEAMADFNPWGGDILRDNKVESFDFTSLVDQFDAEGATVDWQLTDEVLSGHLLEGSDTDAIGGDIAYLYGNNIDPTGAGLINTQSVISTAGFGQTPQTLNATNLVGGGGEGGW